MSDFPVIFNDGSCPRRECEWCGEPIHRGDDYSETGGDTICGHCADSARKEHRAMASQGELV